MNNFKDARKLAVAGILIAIDIILTRNLSIETPVVRIGFAFIAAGLQGALLGPVFGGLTGAAADLIGITLFPKLAGFFPGFTVSAFVRSFIYGYFFYQKDINVKRIVMASVTSTVVVSLIMNTIWLKIITGNPFLALLATRLVSSGILMAVEIAVFSVILGRLVRESNKILNRKNVM
ncbi:MAG: folate family ECF transporter S component [Tissierellia bacterium]|nr:folate family ECF transporter S component [Tissierellia bacterium]